MGIKVTRREFAVGSLSSATAIAIGTGVPTGWMNSLAASLSDQAPQERILVIIQMSGGNDGLNTIVPYTDERYVQARPKLAIPKKEVIAWNAETGLHPSMRGISKLMEQRQFSAIHGVGYPNPNRSHFESMDIWHSCQRKEKRTTDGWLGRLFAANAIEKPTDAYGMHLGSESLPLAMVGRGVQTPSIASVDQFRLKGDPKPLLAPAESLMRDDSDNHLESSESSLLDFVSASTSIAMQASERLEKALANPDNAGDFPESPLGEKLKVISRLILAGLKTQVYYVTLDGFDTHANQAAAHQGLLRQWSDALLSFHNRMNSAGQRDRVLVLSFSEFGRRVAENASLGTDHGAAAPVFLSGPNFENAIVGQQPSLRDLDDGDLKFQVDFRSIYATLIEDWLGTDSKKVLLDDYPKVPGLNIKHA